MINWKKYYKNIPSSIKINKATYEVLWTNDFPKDHDQLGESRFGEVKQIVINLNQPIKEAVHTYFHEMIHAISVEYEVNMTEKQVRAFEKSLKVFVENGNMFKEKEGISASNKTKWRNTRKVR
jgi:hypothetical protein